ncbi:MAG: hypothetical protein AAFR61_02870 [Bacteroidota bacterium]
MYNTIRGGLLFLFCCLATFSGFSQGFNYQAVARSDSGLLRVNENINVRFSILEGSPTGTEVHREIHISSTNEYALFSLVVGKGAQEAGVGFSNIDWSAGPHYLAVEINGVSMGTTELQTVPYSKIATQMQISHLTDVEVGPVVVDDVLKWNGTAWAAGTDRFEDADADSTNELQTLTLSGNDISLSRGGGTVSLPADADADSTNELQTLTLTGNDISLSNGGGTITIPANADADPTNELQTLTLSGTSLSLSNGGGTVALPADGDGDSSNEIQSLSISGNNLSLSNGGGTVPLPPDGDGDSNNEIQSLSISGNNISLSNGGGTVAIPNNSVWNKSGTTAFYTSGNVAVGTTATTDKFRVSSSTSSGRLVSFEKSNTAAGEDVLELKTQSGAPGTAAFIEMQRGTIIEASINTDGSAEFSNVTVQDDLNSSTTPVTGRMYANSLPVAYAYVTSTSSSASLTTDYGISSVSRLSTGVYRLNLNKTISGNPVILATVRSTNPTTIAISASRVSSTQIEVNTASLSGVSPNPIPVNASFYVVVFGTPN